MSADERLSWARTIAGEARNQPVNAQRAVAFVPWNRACISGRSVAFECRKPAQFSCWNDADPNRQVIEAMTVAQLAPFLALIAEIDAGCVDPSNGATFYHTQAVSPRWALGRRPCALVGAHIFYKGMRPYVRRAHGTA